MNERNKIGVVAHSTVINVYEAPDTRSDTVQVIYFMTKLGVDEQHSTRDFYRVRTENGIDGYCKKDLVEITDI